MFRSIDEGCEVTIYIDLFLLLYIDGELRYKMQTHHSANMMMNTTFVDTENRF